MARFLDLPSFANIMVLLQVSFWILCLNGFRNFDEMFELN